MALIQFVRNYDDLSSERGFQFKFHCDKCGNGFMTQFETSTVGMAESVLGVASSLLGGWARLPATRRVKWSAQWAADCMMRRWPVR